MNSPLGLSVGLAVVIGLTVAVAGIAVRQAAHSRGGTAVVWFVIALAASATLGAALVRLLFP